METMETGDERPRKDEEKVPEVVKNEPDDKPAANTIKWTIFIAVVVLLIVYALFFHSAE